MAKVFISYSRESETLAKALANDIQALGHPLWLDRDLTGGQAWWDQILFQIRECAVFVLVLDRASLDSTACNREWTYAGELGKPILPVLVSDGVSENLLPPSLSKVQFVDYRTRNTDTALQLARAIATLPPPRPLPDALPTPPEVPLSYLGGLVARIDGAAPIRYEDQSALVVDLKRALRDPKTLVDARSLLERLRRRRDLFASIAEEIDAVNLPMPANTRRSTSPSKAEESKPESHEGKDHRFDAVAAAEGSSHELDAVDSRVGRSSLPLGATLPDRALGAVVLGAFGLGVGLFCLAISSFKDAGVEYFGQAFAFYASHLPWYYVTFGSVVAGAISGRNRRMVIGAFIGMAWSPLLFLFLPPKDYGDTGSFYWKFLVTAAIAPPLGALAGLIGRRK
jgi:hypothetical protein